jgi:hypothetical protein
MPRTGAAGNPAPDDLARSLTEFVAYRNQYLRGDEKGEAQVFLDRLFTALGHGGVREAGAVLEERLRRREGRSVSFADLVWRPRVLIEMKKAGEDLRRHYRQAFEYWVNCVPNRPRYVMLCNFDDLWIYDFDTQLDEPVDRVKIADLPRRWESLTFLLPVAVDPIFGNDLVAVTRQSASKVAGIFNLLVDRGVDRATARRFVLQSVMAMFAQDIQLLPSHTFTKALEDSLSGGDAFDLLFGQFREMNIPGTTAAGRYAGTPYFNGGLYSVVRPFALEADEVAALHRACALDWSQVRPEIFGTLFEASLGKSERHAFGAHYTNPVDIARIVGPTIVRPWNDAIDAAWDRIPALERLLGRLSQYRVLDPACGCGNFLYIAYRELRRLERRITARIEERRRGGRAGMYGLTIVSTSSFFGMDINPFACEIAKVTLMVAKKLSTDELDDHVEALPLDDLDTNFTVGDALFVPWPAFDACIGNPPYLGRRRIVQERGADYAAQLAQSYPEVGGVSDYVTYWFRRAHDLMPPDGRAGLVGTNSIREGNSRVASLDYLVDNGGVITDAVSSLRWSGEAQVHVSIVNWAKRDDGEPKSLWVDEATIRLDLPAITSSLTASLDVRAAATLACNKQPKRCFQGQTPGHVKGFVLTPEEAADLLQADLGAVDVVKPFFTGDELNGTGRPERWIIDFPHQDAAAARQAAPKAFRRVRRLVLPDRRAKAEAEAAANAEASARRASARVNWHHRNFLDRWWQLSYRRADLLEAVNGLTRYIGLSRYAVAERPSIYEFVDPDIRPSDKMMVFAFDDDYSFGVLTSSLHRAWFETRCATLGQAVSYTSRTVFDTFPWPQSPTAQQVTRVVDAAAAVLEHRQARLTQGISLVDQYDALRSPGRNPLRTLHERLDESVLDCYGFSAADDPLSALLTLNLSTDAAARAGAPVTAPGANGWSGVRRTRRKIRAPRPS